jgi:hypothetical protein
MVYQDLQIRALNLTSSFMMIVSCAVPYKIKIVSWKHVILIYRVFEEE